MKICAGDGESCRFGQVSETLLMKASAEALFQDFHRTPTLMNAFTVASEDEQYFEYVNCRILTGMLRSMG